MWNVNRCFWFVRVVQRRCKIETTRWVLDRIALVMEDYKVHIGSLSYSTDEESLRKFFEDRIQLEVTDGKLFCEDNRCKRQRWSEVMGTSASKLKILLKFELTSRFFLFKQLCPSAKLQNIPGLFLIYAWLRVATSLNWWSRIMSTDENWKVRSGNEFGWA